MLRQVFICLYISYQYPGTPKYTFGGRPRNLRAKMNLHGMPVPLRPLLALLAPALAGAATMDRMVPPGELVESERRGPEPRGRR
jgi:hypothetical protein